MASDEPFLFCPMGYLPFFSLWPLMTPLGHKEKDRQPRWTKEKGVIRGHEEKKDRQPYGQNRKGSSSEVIKRISALLLFMASDDPSLFVHWVVSPSLYDL
jgi:hypothetical protein